MTTHTDHPVASIETCFSDEEVRALEVIRIRFQGDHDTLSTRERAHLCFLRWLVCTRRLVP